MREIGVVSAPPRGLLIGIKLPDSRAQNHAQIGVGGVQLEAGHAVGPTYDQDAAIALQHPRKVGAIGDHKVAEAFGVARVFEGNSMLRQFSEVGPTCWSDDCSGVDRQTLRDPVPNPEGVARAILLGQGGANIASCLHAR